MYTCPVFIVETWRNKDLKYILFGLFSRMHITMKQYRLSPSLPLCHKNIYIFDEIINLITLMAGV